MTDTIVSNDQAVMEVNEEEEIQKKSEEKFRKEEPFLNIKKEKDQNGRIYYTCQNIKHKTVYALTRETQEDGSYRIVCSCPHFEKNAAIEGFRCKHIICLQSRAKQLREEELKTIIHKEEEDEGEMIGSNGKGNGTSTFNPEKFLTKIKGKDYLEVKFRVHWMRLEHPEWNIQTVLQTLDLERGIAVVQADVIDEQGKHLSSGLKMEYQKNFFDFLEKAETGAVGRALACLGYGTLQCFDLEEGVAAGRIADAPVSLASATGKATGNRPAGGNGGNGGGNGKPNISKEDLDKIYSKW